MTDICCPYFSVLVEKDSSFKLMHHFVTDGEKKPQEMTLHSVDHPLSSFYPNHYQSKSLLDQKKRAITKVG